MKDLRNIEDFIGRLRSNYLSGRSDFPTDMDLLYFKNELNNVTGNTIKCVKVIFTNNTDKMFFGMCVYPNIPNAQVNEILFTDKEIKITTYLLEIDSKLFDIGLTAREVTAIMLHEIGHIVLNKKNIFEFRKYFDKYITDNNMVNTLKKGRDSNLFSIAISDTIIKALSIFYANNDEFRADSFAVSCGYGQSLINAMKKVNASNKIIKPVVKFSILDWVFRNQASIIPNSRVAALEVLTKAKAVYGSAIYQQRLADIIENIRLGSIYTEDSDIFTEKSFSAKYKGMRAVEDDFYEYSVRVKNAETEEDVFFALRGINYRMRLIDDFLNINGDDLDDREIKRWSDLYSNYNALRNELSTKKSYNFKTYGLYFDYNKLDQE